MRKKLVTWMAAALIGTMTLSMAACGGSKDTPADAGGNAADAGGDAADAGGDAAKPQDNGEEAAEAPEDSGSQAGSDVKIGIVVKTATNAHFQDIAYGAMLAGKELNVEVKVDNTATESDVEGQVTKCENMITGGVDALILTANDSEGVSGAVDAAHDAGIPFVTVDTTITNVWGDDVFSYMPNYIGVNHTDMAYEMAKQVFEAAGGKGNLVILEGVAAASSSNERTAGFKKALEEYSDIQLVEDQHADYDQDTAHTTMGDIIQRGEEINIVLCCNDLMALGAITALEENGIAVGEGGVLVAGIDGSYLALQSIDEGKLYATAYDWSILQGYYAVMQAYDLIQGTEVPQETMTPDTIITSENVADYLPHGEELDKWSMGSAISEVSEYMADFLEMGKGM